jgi:hypothetical protein
VSPIRYGEGDAFVPKRKKELEAKRYRQVFTDDYNALRPGEFLITDTSDPKSFDSERKVCIHWMDSLQLALN